MLFAWHRRLNGGSPVPCAQEERAILLQQLGGRPVSSRHEVTLLRAPALKSPSVVFGPPFTTITEAPSAAEDDSSSAGAAADDAAAPAGLRRPLVTPSPPLGQPVPAAPRQPTTTVPRRRLESTPQKFVVAKEAGPQQPPPSPVQSPREVAQRGTRRSRRLDTHMPGRFAEANLAGR